MDTHSQKPTIFLETSSYLPLIWRTPYSQSVIEYLSARRATHQFVLQRDCVREASGYLSFQDNWKYHPGIRLRTLVRRLSDDEFLRLSFPSTAVQILLGGNIWPQAQYLNFIRHSAFFFIDLLDGISFVSPREGLLEFADRIDERVKHIRILFENHLSVPVLHLPNDAMLSYWGTWYLIDVPEPFTRPVPK